MSDDSMTDTDDAPDFSDDAYQGDDFNGGEMPGGSPDDLADGGGLQMPDGSIGVGDGMYEVWREEAAEEREEREEEAEERQEQEQQREQEEQQREEQEQEREREEREREEEDEAREERNYEMFGG
ncbi:MAG TPA: hypothetical protein VFU73_03615 [Actinocrinis sp.]|nr:hypothetical protein [Actinocrinis sp.]